MRTTPRLSAFTVLLICSVVHAQSVTQINTNAQALANTLNGTAAGNINSTNAQAVPGYSTSNGSQSYFGNGVGNPIAPGIAAVTTCSTATDPSCQGVNLLSNGATNRTTWPINPTTDPTITTGQNAITNPLSGLGTGFNGTFLNQQTVNTCTSTTTPSPAQYATFTCQETLVFGNQSCAPYQDVVVVPTFHYTCVGAPYTLNNYNCSNVLAVTVTQHVGCNISGVSPAAAGYMQFSATCNAANLGVLSITTQPALYCQYFSSGWCNATYYTLNLILAPPATQSGTWVAARNYTGQLFGNFSYSYDGAGHVTLAQTVVDGFSVTAGLGQWWLPALCPAGDISQILADNQGLGFTQGVCDSLATMNASNTSAVCNGPGPWVDTTGLYGYGPLAACSDPTGVNPAVNPTQSGSTFTCPAGYTFGGQIYCQFPTNTIGVVISVSGGTTITYTTSDSWANGCATYQANL